MRKPTTTHTHTARRPRVFYGWWIATAAAVQGFYFSATFYQGFTAFFNPIVKEFGWSRAATAAATSLQRTESGVIGPFVGFFIDRYGVRWVILTGTVIIALGFFFLARVYSLMAFYGAILTIALGLALASSIATTVVVGNWFVRHRSRAMTIAFGGGAFGGTMAPLLVWAIGRYGWRPVLDWIGLGTLLVCIPAALVMRYRPESYGYRPDGLEPQTDGSGVAAPGDARSTQAASAPRPSVVGDGGDDGFTFREMLRLPAFWQLMLSMGIGGLVMSSVGLFSIPGLESFGISTGTAGLVVLFTSVFNVAGRFGLGFLGDVVDKRYILAATFLVMALGSLAFAAIHQPWHIIFFLLLYPPGHGGTVPVRYSLLAEYFGRRSYGALIGVTMTLTAIFGIVGPVFTGWMFDVTGSYRWPFVIMGGVGLIAVPLTLAVKPPMMDTSVSSRATTPDR
ncbi:MAG: MFS transporter [Chloroflexi bacterium]|nr:MFS transporter [Chloroflexota bacterium]